MAAAMPPDTSTPTSTTPTTPPAAGYSGTPLAQKLGLKEGMAIHAVGAPAEWMDWLQPLPPGLQWQKRTTAQTDLVLLFTDSAATLATHLQTLRQSLQPRAALWVCWPKKASKVPTDITEDTIRQLALPMGWVDVKVCAVSAVWSGLKLMVRKDQR